MDIPRIYHGYTSNDIPCISMDIRGIHDGYTRISMYIPRISTPLDIHGISMDIHGYPRDIDQGYTSIDIPCISMDIRGIYMMDIHGYPCIYHVLYPP